MHSTCRAPFHVARFELQQRRLAALWSDLLAAGRQVDHHAVDLVFVWLSFGVRLGHDLEHASLVVIDWDLPVLTGEAGSPVPREALRFALAYHTAGFRGLESHSQRPHPGVIANAV